MPFAELARRYEDHKSSDTASLGEERSWGTEGPTGSCRQDDDGDDYDPKDIEDEIELLSKSLTVQGLRDGEQRWEDTHSGSLGSAAKASCQWTTQPFVHPEICWLFL